MTGNIYHIMCSQLQNYKKIYSISNTLPKKLFFLTKGASNSIYIPNFNTYHL